MFYRGICVAFLAIFEALGLASLGLLGIILFYFWGPLKQIQVLVSPSPYGFT